MKSRFELIVVNSVLKTVDRLKQWRVHVGAVKEVKGGTALEKKKIEFQLVFETNFAWPGAVLV